MLIRKLIPFLSIFTILSSQGLRDIGNWELINEYSHPENVTAMAYSYPTKTHAGEPIIWEEFIRFNDKHSNTKVYNTELGQYIIDHEDNQDKQFHVGDEREYFNINNNTKTIFKWTHEKIISDDSVMYYNASYGWDQWRLHYEVMDLYGNTIREYSPLPKGFSIVGEPNKDGRFLSYDSNRKTIGLYPNSDQHKIIVSDIPELSEWGFGNTFYNHLTQDIILHGKIENKKREGLNLIGAIDKDNNLLWERRISEEINMLPSPSGNYFVIHFVKPNGKQSLEIVNRTGKTVNIFDGVDCLIYCSSTFSLITLDDRYLICSSRNHSKVFVYDLLSGETINRFVFGGGHPIKSVRYSNDKQLIYVLFYKVIDVNTVGVYVGVYPLDGTTKRPLARIKIDEFDRKLMNTASQLSVSENGEEITVLSGKTIKTYRLTLGE